MLVQEPSAFGWYTTVLRRYAVFEGRARRKEYWFFTLFNFLILLGLSIVDALLGFKGMGVLSGLYLLGVLIPTIAVIIRRLHDTGRSGWWFLLSFIPFGGLVLLVFEVLESEPGPNAYGPNPLGENPVP